MFIMIKDDEHDKINLDHEVFAHTHYQHKTDKKVKQLFRTYFHKRIPFP